MLLDYVTLADGRRLAVKQDTTEILHLLKRPHIDTQRLFEVGQRLFAAGGSEPLDAISDQVADRLGQKAAYELVLVWTDLADGDDLAAGP